jgi:hypothetical protein
VGLLLLNALLGFAGVLLCFVGAYLYLPNRFCFASRRLSAAYSGNSHRPLRLASATAGQLGLIHASDGTRHSRTPGCH